MKEELEVKQTPEAENPHPKVSLGSIFTSLKTLLFETLDIRHGADIKGTMESIRRDVVFKGHNIWILILSILIASIGLNLNSGAVIIGAMLISPLMAPILGIGLSVGTNDVNLLASSIRNLLIMMFVAIGTSYVYFMMSPFSEAQSEIIARTKPHLLDAMIAIFGGFAGFIGNSRKERTNIIPGVAIATALMPPLCTVGYGLALQSFEYALGAFYLFLLNSSFICITSLVLVKVMRFPMAKYINKKRQRRVQVWVYLFGIAILIPSFILFRFVIAETTFKEEAKQFLSEEFRFKDSYVFKSELTFRDDTASTIAVYILGEPLDSTQKVTLVQNLNKYKLTNTNLLFKQSKDNDGVFQKELQEVNSTSESFRERLEQANRTITFQDAHITELQDHLHRIAADTIPISDIKKELQIMNDHVEDLFVANFRVPRDSVYELAPLFVIDWSKKDYRGNTSKRRDLAKIDKWLKARLKLDTLIVMKR